MIFYLIDQLVNRPKLLRWLRVRTRKLPRFPVFLLITLFGWGVYACSRATRRRIIANIGELLPHLGAVARHRLCRRYLVHEMLTIYEQAVEYRRALAPSGRGRAHFHIQGLEHLEEALKLGRGAIIYTPHTGNYFYQYWVLSQRYNCSTVITAGSKELRMLFAGMYWFGLKGYDYDNEPPLELMRNLRAHLRDNGVLFIFGDFWRPSFPAGTLFGKPSNAPAGTFMLSLLQKTPILPFYGRREGWYTHRLVFEPPVYLYETYGMEQKEAAQQHLARIMEHLIRQVPDQWLFWFNVHERWEAAAAEKVRKVAAGRPHKEV